MPEERLQKLLARAGFGSRRACESLIEQGEVTVDGRTVTKLGTKVDPEAQDVRCRNRRVNLPTFVYYALHKPRRTISSTRDERGRRTVMDMIRPLGPRVYPIGRLDYDSEGLLLLTNDGEFCNLLTHPRYQVEKTYHVLLRGVLKPEIRQKIERGVWLSDGKTGPARIQVRKVVGGRTVLEITIREGLNREIRRIFARFDLKVLRLKRIRIGSVSLGVIPRGAYRPLGPREVDGLKALARGFRDRVTA
jgi:pseudouridine synthase